MGHGKNFLLLCVVRSEGGGELVDNRLEVRRRCLILERRLGVGQERGLQRVHDDCDLRLLLGHQVDDCRRSVIDQVPD